MKSKIILISLLCIFSTTMQAQSVSEWLQTARTAFENGEYRTVLTNVAKIEDAVGSATRPATAYLRIMSHYRLKEYEQCVSAANAYLGAQPAQDETLTEIRTALADAKEQVQLAEAAKQKKLAEQEAERQRQAELARQKAAREREAAAEWEKLKTSEDLTALSSFLNKYGNTPPYTAAKSRYDDEKAWQDAKKENSMDRYENYLNGNTLKNHRQEARDILESGYVYRCRQYAEESKTELMEDMYSRYAKMFPGGKETENLKKTMCEVYYKKGMELSKNQNSLADLKQSGELLGKAKNICASNVLIDKTVKSNTLKITDLERPSGHFFIGYSGDLNAPIGLSLGWLSQHSFGFYLSARANAVFFKKGREFLDLRNDYKVTLQTKVETEMEDIPADFFETNQSWSTSRYITGANYQSGSTGHGGSYDVIRETITPLREFEYGEFSAVVGTNKRIIYPLWAYLGAGVNLNKTFYSVQIDRQLKHTADYTTDHSWRDSKEKLNSFTTGKMNIYPLLDFGLQVRLNALYLSAGLRSNFQQGGSTLTFGGGFAF
jgi:hypothetical protein